MATAYVRIEGNIDPAGTIWPGQEYCDGKRLRVQLDAQRPFDAIEARINSPGGEVDTGYEMYDILRSENVPVTTIAIGKCASIATVIFMAGDERLVSPNSKPMIHLPLTKAEGNMIDIQNRLNQLVGESNRLLNFYLNQTHLPADKVAAMMAAETRFTAQEFIDAGFATGVYAPVTARDAIVAFSPQSTNPTKQPAMATIKDALKRGFDSILASLNGETTTNLDLMVEGGQTLVTESMGTDPAIGDAAMIDGAPAPTGDYLLVSGITVVVTDGIVTDVVPVAAIEEVVPPATATEDAPEVVATATPDPRDARIAELEAQLAAQVTASEQRDAAITARLNTITAALGVTYSKDPDTVAKNGKQPGAKVGDGVQPLGMEDVLALNKAKFGKKK